jgi:hypothetical protein
MVGPPGASSSTFGAKHASIGARTTASSAQASAARHASVGDAGVDVTDVTQRGLYVTVLDVATRDTTRRWIQQGAMNN